MFFVADVGLQQDNTTNQFQNKMFEQMFEHLGQTQRAYEKLLGKANEKDAKHYLELLENELAQVDYSLRELDNLVEFLNVHYNLRI